MMTVHLGVYALGAADAEERQLVEDHLPGCPECRAELVRLAPLPGLLARVPHDMLPTPSRRGRPARRWRVAAVAAVAAAAATGIAGGIWLAPRGATPPPAALTLSGANPATHVQATAALTATSWGTSIQLQVRGVPLNEPCRLIVRSRAGGTEVTGFWDAWNAAPVTVPASAAWRPSDIASLQVATKARTLVTIAAPRAAGSGTVRSNQPAQTP
jgi:hypothetical protein